MIPFASFEPDRSQYALDASTVVTNCLPIRDGWGPLPDLVAISSSLGSVCKGAIYVRTTLGAYRLIAGTETGLYELNTTDYTWTTLTRTSGPYAVPPSDRWSFEKFGDYLVAVNLTDAPQYIAITGGVLFEDIPGSPPRAKYVWTAGEFLVLGHIQDFPNRIQTSGIGDLSFWTIGQKGCDFQDFPDGEEVMGGISAERGATIFQRTKIRQMTIAAAGDYSFTTSVVNSDRGVIAPLSLAQIGPGQFVYYSADGFFMGAEGRPIGAERVDQWFQATFDSDMISEIRGIADPFQKIVWWQAQTPTKTQFLLGYDWQLDRWCLADNNVTEMCALVTPGVSWDGLDVLYSNIDAVDVPFDSSLFSGGAPRFAAFTTDNRLGFFTGAARAASLETATMELAPGSRAFLQEARVYTDSNNFTLNVGTASRHGQDPSFGTPVSPYPETGVCHFRASGLLHRFRMEIPSGETWTNVIGLEHKARAEGRR